MEMVEPWYSTEGLEADQVKARQQASLTKRKNMAADPRISKPFEEIETAGPVSHPFSFPSSCIQNLYIYFTST